MSAAIKKRLAEIGPIEDVERVRLKDSFDMGILHVRGALEALNQLPDDGLMWRTKLALLQAMNDLVQERRRLR